MKPLENVFPKSVSDFDSPWVVPLRATFMTSTPLLAQTSVFSINLLQLQRLKSTQAPKHAYLQPSRQIDRTIHFVAQQTAFVTCNSK
jgi:hypothetical protein